jgi:hypothetical protein
VRRWSNCFENEDDDEGRGRLGLRALFAESGGAAVD